VNRREMRWDTRCAVFTCRQWYATPSCIEAGHSVHRIIVDCASSRGFNKNMAVSYMDICRTCLAHESYHIGGRCLLRPSRFK
jgi:hypothetical protein